MIPPLVDGLLPPGEWEATWDELTFSRRPQQKAEFGCEFFPNIVEAGSGVFFVQFFQTDRKR